MERKRSQIQDFSVYLVIRMIVCFVQMLPLESALRLADGLAWLIYQLNRRHRLVADDNLKHAFNELRDPIQRDRVVRGVYRHYCRMLMVMIHLPRCFHTQSWRHYLDMTPARELIKAMVDGRPVLLVTAHFGNWELGGYTLGVFGFPSYAIARPLDNPYLEKFLKRFRQRTGQTILAKHGNFDRMQEILDTNGVIATLGDQDAGQRGLYVDFFGRPASTHKAIALMSLQYNVPLVVLGIPCVDGKTYHQLIVEDVIEPQEYADHSDAIPAMTQRFTTAVETMVRRHPEQYFWLHRRWKHQMKGKQVKKVK